MASYAMHLAISKLYLENHKNEIVDEFIRGTIDVDNVVDKAKTHYSKKEDTQNTKKWLEAKVCFENYIKENTIKTSYNRGYFLHLLADYYFYNCFFDEEFLNSLNPSEFRDYLYDDYNTINQYIINKYQIIKPKELDDKFFATYNGTLKIMTYDGIDEFISFISTLDIDKIFNMIVRDENILLLYDKGE